MNDTSAVDILGSAIQEAASVRLRELADRIEKYAIEEIDNEKLIAFGRLRQAIHTKVKGLSLDVYVDDRAPYAQYLHEGIEPHMPPIGPLMEWAKKKLGLKGRLDMVRLKWRKRGGYSVNRADLDTQEQARSMAWAVAMKIKKEGRKPTPFLRNAIEKALSELK